MYPAEFLNSLIRKVYAFCAGDKDAVETRGNEG